jgi:UDP-N-acetylmuramyl pentapeptide phosphotransferase/UDP-N-acetylglucosamine-1-phosphate transferase
VSHGVIIALELTGAVLILAAFTLAQLRWLDQHSRVYLVLNMVGSFVLAVIAWLDERWGSCSWRVSGRSSRRRAWSPFSDAGPRPPTR